MLLIIFGLLAQPAFARTPVAKITAIKLSREVVALIKKANLDDRQKGAIEIFDRYFDFETFAQWTLYEHWGKITAEQKAQFLKLFRERFTENIIDRISKQTNKKFRAENITVRHAKEYTEVKCNVRHDGESMSLSLFWVIRKDKWYLADLTIAKANLVANYQGQFNKIIRERGFDELLRRFRDKKL